MPRCDGRRERAPSTGREGAVSRWHSAGRSGGASRQSPEPAAASPETPSPLVHIFRHPNAPCQLLDYRAVEARRGAHSAPSVVTTSFRPPRSIAGLRAAPQRAKGLQQASTARGRRCSRGSRRSAGASLSRCSSELPVRTGGPRLLAALAAGEVGSVIPSHRPCGSDRHNRLVRAQEVGVRLAGEAPARQRSYRAAAEYRAGQPSGGRGRLSSPTPAFARPGADHGLADVTDA